ncbi:MAG: tRNA nucleotidyltransferase [Bacilli bacterium]|nr:tRNA nucleotidyltransferase [Bacilli bacterium]
MEKAANQLLQVLSAHQFEAYFVGGYVRDRILNKPIQDIDIATSALPQQVMQLFPHTIPTGLKHGTVTVIIDDQAFEVTTFRKESSYEEHRRPQHVEFVSDLVEDLQRRDFTINAMAMDSYGGIKDPFNGQADIEKGIVRCVGNPDERFQEDALRMLRCIRFAANYHFQIETETWHGLLQNSALLKHVAMERVRVEVEKMIAGSDPFRALQLLLTSKLLQHTKAELAFPLVDWLPSDLPLYIKFLTELESPELRWALLLKSMKISSDKASKILRKLTFSSHQSKGIVAFLKLDQWLYEQVSLALIEQAAPQKKIAVSLAEARLSIDRPALIWKRAAVQFGKEALLGWLQMMQLEKQQLVPLTEQTKKSTADFVFAGFCENGVEWIAEMPVETLADLEITGSDLVEHFALLPGPWVSEMLQRLLLDAAFGNARNQKRYLLQRAEIYRKELKKHE